jgi:Ca2+-binding RTX toxin-like protein
LIGSGEGTAVMTIDGAGSQVYGGAGSLDVIIDAASVIAAGLGANTTVDASSSLASGALVFGGFENTPSEDGTLSVRGGADQLLVVTGGSNSTIDAATSDTVFTGIYIGTGVIAGSNLIYGSASALQVNFIGGAGAATVLGSTGAVTLFGANGTDADFIGSSISGAPGGLLFANGTSVGGETLNAGSSTTNDTLFGSQGNVSLVAGSGTDFLSGGENTGSLGGAGTVTGGDTMVGGSGSDLMFFAHGSFSGGAVITQFSSLDTVLLDGYNSLSGAGGDQAATALANATVAGGNTTIALADGTHITFVDTTAALLQAHLVSS